MSITLIVRPRVCEWWALSVLGRVYPDARYSVRGHYIIGDTFTMGLLLIYRYSVPAQAKQGWATDTTIARSLRTHNSGYYPPTDG